MLLRYAFLWVGLLALALLNATARELLYADAVGELRAQQLSTVTMAGLVFVYTLAAQRIWPLPGAAMAIGVGVLWAVMTAGFEFAMVVLLAGRPVADALEQYDLPAGNLWSLLLVFILLCPLVVWKLRGAARPTS